MFNFSECLTKGESLKRKRNKFVFVVTAWRIHPTEAYNAMI